MQIFNTFYITPKKNHFACAMVQTIFEELKLSYSDNILL